MRNGNMKDRLRSLEVARAPDPLNQRQIEEDAAVFDLKFNKLVTGFDAADVDVTPEQWAAMSLASQLAWSMRFKPSASHP